MDPKDEQPFNREPWRRLLGADSGAPTQDMDRRVLSEAQRALMPRVGRWWLPASLAASLLLAVLIVQWQLADSGAPAHVTESDVLSAPTPIVADKAAPAAAMEALPKRQELPATRAADMPLPEVAQPTMESPRVQETAALADEQPAKAKPAADVIAPEPAQAESSAVTGKFHALTPSSGERRTAEQWYADIVELRATGRIKEADAELVRLKAAYPGWLESHQQPNP
jgi:hypothetical protein